MKTALTFCLILFAFLSKNLSSQNYTQTIRGTVCDAVSKSPLPGASIQIMETNPLVGTSSDANGNFRFEKVPVGRVALKVSYIGYQDRVISNLLLSTGKELVLKIELEEKVITTSTVEIVANVDKDKTRNEMTTVSGRAFTFEETNRYAGSLGDPARMVQNFAGVMSAGDSRNDIIIRGNSPSGLLWRLEGIEIPNPNHFGALGTTGGPVSILNNNLLTNSDFYTGAFPAEFGNAISGVFDLSMRSGNNEKYEFVAQTGFNGFELGAEGPFSKKYDGSFLINYRYSTLAVFKLLGIKSITGSSVPQYQDLAFKFDLPTKKFGKFILFGMGGISYININDEEKDSTEFSYGLGGTNTDFGSNMGVVGLSHAYYFNSNSRLKTTIALQSSESYTIIDSLGTDTTPDFAMFRNRFIENKLNVSTNYLQKINSKNVFTAGASFQYFGVVFVDSAFSSDEQKFVTINDIKGNLSLWQAFAQWKHKFTDKFNLNFGLHYQLFSLNNSKSLEPRLGFQYQINPKTSFNGGYGRHSQSQTKMLYFVQTKLNDGSLTYSNNDLGFTTSDQFVLGLTHSISKNWRVKTELYYQHLSNVPVSQSMQDYTVLNEGSYFAISLMDSLTNKGKGKNYGVELTIEKNLSKNYYILLNSSFFRSLSSGYNAVERPTAYDNKFVVNALAGYEWKLKGSSINFDIKTVYSGGKPYIPIDESKSMISGSGEYVWEDAYENQLADYFRFDIRIAYKTYSKRLDQEWALDLQNVTNHQNVFMQSWDSKSNTLKTDYQQGFFPMMLYRIYF